MTWPKTLDDLKQKKIKTKFMAWCNEKTSLQTGKIQDVIFRNC